MQFLVRQSSHCIAFRSSRHCLPSVRMQVASADDGSKRVLCSCGCGHVVQCPRVYVASAKPQFSIAQLPKSLASTHPRFLASSLPLHYATNSVHTLSSSIRCRFRAPPSLRLDLERPTSELARSLATSFPRPTPLAPITRSPAALASAPASLRLHLNRPTSELFRLLVSAPYYTTSVHTLSSSTRCRSIAVSRKSTRARTIAAARSKLSVPPSRASHLLACSSWNATAKKTLKARCRGFESDLRTEGNPRRTERFSR